MTRGDSCCATDLESGFDERVAARDVAAYRRDGLPADQRRLLAGLVADGLGDQTVLDIGGGIGAIHHDLLRAGARSVMDVDGSTAYLNAEGFEPVVNEATWFWWIALYRRVKAAVA